MAQSNNIIEKKWRKVFYEKHRKRVSYNKKTSFSPLLMIDAMCTRLWSEKFLDPLAFFVLPHAILPAENRLSQI